MVNDLTNDIITNLYLPITDTKANYGVGVLIVNDGKLLLAKRVDTWEYGSPGGKVEYGENPIEAIKRECKEESNLDLDNICFLGCFTHNSPIGKEWISFSFLALNIGLENLKNQKSEMEEFSLYSLDEANNLNLFPPTKESIKMAIEHKVFENTEEIPYITCPDTTKKVQDSVVCQYSYNPPGLFENKSPVLTSPWIIWD